MRIERDYCSYIQYDLFMVNDILYLDLKFGSLRSLHSSPSTTSSVLQSGSLKKMAGRPLLLAVNGVPRPRKRVATPKRRGQPDNMVAPGCAKEERVTETLYVVVLHNTSSFVIIGVFVVLLTYRRLLVYIIGLYMKTITLTKTMP